MLLKCPALDFKSINYLYVYDEELTPCFSGTLCEFLFARQKDEKIGIETETEKSREKDDDDDEVEITMQGFLLTTML